MALVGDGAEVQVNGAMFTEGKQHLSYHTLQHHQAAACRSDLLYKGALQDKSRIVWRRIAIRVRARLTTLVLLKGLAEGEGAAGIAKAFDDFLAIVSMLNEVLAAQVSFDVDALVRASDRLFVPEEVAGIKAVQSRAFRHTFLLSGMTHPNFVTPISELSSDGAARVALFAQALA